MADRVVNQPALLLVDIPRAAGETVSVEVRDGIGVQVFQGIADNPFGARFTVSLPASAMQQQGIWRAIWTYTTGEVTTRFTVGPARAVNITKYELRRLIGEATTNAYESAVVEANDVFLADSELLGGPDNYRGWYVVLDYSTPDAGIAKRVTDFNGSSLMLSSGFSEDPPEGTPYVLFELDPRKIDRALDLAIADFSEISRLPVTFHGVPVSDLGLNVPEGVTWVAELAIDGKQVPLDEWEVLPGRRIALNEKHDEVTSVSLSGIRHHTKLVWDDSVIDIEAGPVVARARQHLHSGMAAGQGIDVNENMRRQIAAENEYQAARRWIAGRMIGGAKKVLE